MPLLVDHDHSIGHRQIYALKRCPGRVVDLDVLGKRVRASATVG